MSLLYAGGSQQREPEVHAQLEKLSVSLEEHQGVLSDLFTKLECVREPVPTPTTEDIDPPQGATVKERPLLVKVHHRLALSIQRLSRMTRQVEEVSAELMET